jgi:hypothetical protein
MVLDVIDIYLIALRTFTLESGQEEIERKNRRRKEGVPDPLDLAESRRGSVDSLRSPSTSHPARAPVLSDVPEETFAIGDDEDEDEEDDNDHRRPSYPPAPTIARTPSRASSVSSHIDETVPMQLRGMSEKARGKMPGTLLNPRFRCQLTDCSSWYANILTAKQHNKSKQPLSARLSTRKLRTYTRMDRILASRSASPHNPDPNIYPLAPHPNILLINRHTNNLSNPDHSINAPPLHRTLSHQNPILRMVTTKSRLVRKLTMEFCVYI